MKTDLGNITINKESIHISAGPTKKTVTLNFDGTFERHHIPTTQLNPIRFFKICPMCNKSQGLPKQFGQSTTIEVMYQQYHYSFQVWADPKTGFFTTVLDSELISYLHERATFYNIETSFLSKQSILRHGARLNGMLDVKLPIINLKNVNDTTALMNKIKLLATFS